MKDHINKTVPYMVYKLKHYHIDSLEKGLDVIKLNTSIISTIWDRFSKSWGNSLIGNEREKKLVTLSNCKRDIIKLIIEV